MRFRFLSKSKISQLSKSPGVYAFSAAAPTKSELRRIRRSSLKASEGGKKGRELLYIGKAANLRERVKNHFQQPAYRDNLFINRVSKVGYFKTDSEIEALILEANLIKKHQPKYNVMWRDDKNYFFVSITKEEFPRVFITHQPAKVFTKQKLRRASPKLKIKYVGPFIDGKSLKATLKILRKVFPYRSCRTLPKRPCLWYQLSRCPAPCQIKSKVASQIPNFDARMKDECQQNAKNLLKILQGKKKQVLRDLNKEMKKASALQNFERAAKIRDQIESLEKVLAHVRIFEPQIERIKSEDWKKTENMLKKLLKIKGRIKRIEAYDVSNIQGQEATGSMVTFTNGKPNKDFYRKFKIKIAGKPNDIAMIKEILKRRFKHPEWPFPDLILIDGGKAQLNAAQSTINNQQLTIPVVALAKKKNELFIEGQKKPILLKNLPREIFNLILQLRDEAHRFARSYHHKLREKTLLL